MKRWALSKKSTFNIGYHIVFCPKYRRQILVGPIENRLRTIITDRAREINVSIESLEIMPDHVHLFVKATPVDSPHWIVQQFKGPSSRLLRQEFLELLKMPSLWTRSYYIGSVGHISEDTIKKYIESQKGK